MTRKSDTPCRDHSECDPLEAFQTLTPAAWMSAAWIGVLSDLGAEISTFVAKRIKEDMEAQQELLGCKLPSEMTHVQAEFFQKAFDQYHVETGKLVELSAQMTARLRSETDNDA